MTLPIATRDGRANLIRAFKASGCCDCKRRYPELDWNELHIDHIDPRDKEFVATFNRLSVPALIAEFLRSQVLCHDCHKAKHRNGGASPENQLALFNGSGGWRY